MMAFCHTYTVLTLTGRLKILKGTLSKQDGNAPDDDSYSHNVIPDLVQKKLIIKSPTVVRDVVLGLFTTANQRCSRLVYNANMSRRDK
jgi:hypothetical protein